jgi:hypothetical protein
LLARLLATPRDRERGETDWTSTEPKAPKTESPVQWGGTVGPFAWNRGDAATTRPQSHFASLTPSLRFISLSKTNHQKKTRGAIGSPRGGRGRRRSGQAACERWRAWKRAKGRASRGAETETVRPGSAIGHRHAKRSAGGRRHFRRHARASAEHRPGTRYAWGARGAIVTRRASAKQSLGDDGAPKSGPRATLRAGAPSRPTARRRRGH